MATADAMVGRRLGRYLVLETIGSGGMGVVYRAHDEQLDRDVAIKVLNAVTHSSERDRRQLKNEARALSRLNHPNIETIYDFEIEDGLEFLVIELLSGKSLSDKIEGPFTEGDTVRIGLHIAEALIAAHRHGVVHCDLKPSNVFITNDGQTKVLDFGLARLLALADTDSTESLGARLSPVGTLPYMAPEQFLHGNADERTDIYCLGAILYEMATGQRPFQQKTAVALQHAIIKDPPSSPRSLNPTISQELDRIIGKCLEKDPYARYQSAKEVSLDLQGLISYWPVQKITKPFPWKKGAIAAGLVAALVIAIAVAVKIKPHSKPRGDPASKPAGTAVGPMRIAVLPFESLGASPERNYVAEGLADELAGLLSRVRTLQVIAPDSFRRLNKTTLTLTEVSRQFGARYFVTGSVEWNANQMRIRVRMLDDSIGILWARSFDRKSSDNLAIENEVAQEVVRSLALTVGGDEKQALATPPTQNSQAFDAYLRGKTLVTRFNNRGLEEDFVAAQSTLRTAIQLDSQMAEAYGELAHLYFLHDVERARPTKDPERLRVAAQQALAIDPQQVAALDALAMMYVLRNEDDIAYFHALKVLSVAPYDPGALVVLGAVYGNNGLLEDALAAFRKAGETDPLYLYPMTNAAEALLMMGRLDEAWQQNEAAAAIEPENYSVLMKRAWIRYHQGRLDEAEQIIRHATQRVSSAERSGFDLIQAWIYSRQGHHEQARALLSAVENLPPASQSLDRQMWLAEGWALENAPDKSLPLLTTVANAHPNYPWFVRNENLQSLRGNPAFDKLLSDLKVQWEKNRAKFQSSSEVLHGNAV